MSKKGKKTELSVQDILQEYQAKIFRGNYKIYNGFPLSLEDTKKCKTLEENMAFLRQTIYLNAYKNLGYDINQSFGVRNDTKIADIPEHVPSKRKQQDYPFPLNDEFRRKLLTSPKFKIHSETKFGEINLFSGKIPYKSDAVYYATSIEHKGKKQVVVIKVKIDYQNEKGSKYLEPYDFSGVSIVALLGKRCKKVMSLARLDFNKSKTGYGHQNFLDENENSIDFGASNWSKHLIRGTHLHMQSEKFELINPNCLGSGTAISVNDEKGFLALRDEMLQRFNFHDNNYTFSPEDSIEQLHDKLYEEYIKEKNKGEEFNR